MVPAGTVACVGPSPSRAELSGVERAPHEGVGVPTFRALRQPRRCDLSYSVCPTGPGGEARRPGLPLQPLRSAGPGAASCSEHCATLFPATQPTPPSTVAPTSGHRLATQAPLRPTLPY